MLQYFQKRLPRTVRSRLWSYIGLLSAFLIMVTLHRCSNGVLTYRKNGYESYSRRQLLMDNSKAAEIQIQEALSSREYCRPYYNDLQRQFTAHMDITYTVNGSTTLIANETTLMTHLAAEQIADLYGFIMGWQGYISASIYIKREDIQHLAYDVITSMKSLKRTNVQIHLIEQQGTYYPTNYLRNVAQDRVLTQYVLYVDVDFRPMRDMQTIMSTYIPEMFATFSVDDALVVAMPAIMTSSNIDYPVRKKEAKDIWLDTVFAFDHNYRNGIQVKQIDQIDHNKWIKRRNSYEVKFAASWTPFYVLDTTVAPRYNEFFVEHIYDRLSHAIEVAFECPRYRVFAPGFFVRKPPALDNSTSGSGMPHRLIDLAECSRMVFDIKYGSYAQDLRKNSLCKRVK